MGPHQGWTKFLLGMNTLEGDVDLNKTVIKLGELNKLACDDLLLSINISSSAGNVAFRWVRNAKSANFPGGNCKIAWNKLVSKYDPHTVLSFWSSRVSFITVS